MLPLQWKPNIGASLILVKFFGLILLLGGIVKIACKSGSNSMIFYMLFIQENKSFLGINYCLLVARNDIKISAKNEDPFCFNSFLTFLKNKLGKDKKRIRDLVTL